MPVPPAWCITTAAYRNVVGDRIESVLDALASTAPTDRARLAELAARARVLIQACELPVSLVSEIERVCAVAGRPLAVRSSATAEDLAEASFAGQQDSFLQVQGAPRVVDAVRSCWASLWSERAVVYRADQGIDPRTVALAVVLQPMVAAEAAGVLFTADPVTGRRGRCVIEASPGLGESVVSGAVDPDRFVADFTGTVVERHLGTRTSAVLPRPDGGTDVVALEPSLTPSLTDDAIRDLAQLGRTVETALDAPQDIEWALDGGGTLWLLQARPITTLFPLLGRPDRPGLRVFLCMSLAQGLTRPVTPLGNSAIGQIGASVAAVLGFPVADPVAGPSALQVAAGRPFIDATAALRHPLGRRVLLAAMSVMEARAAAVLGRLCEQDEFRLGGADPARTVRAVLGLLRVTRAPLRLLAALIAPSSALRAARRVEDDIRSRLSLPPDASPPQRLDLVLTHLRSRAFLVMPAMAPYAGAGFLALAVARRLLRGTVEPGELQQVLRGLPHNPTTEMDLALWSLTERVRRDEPSRRAIERRSDDQLRADHREQTLPTVLQAELTTFLDQYGHRAVAEIDLGMPRWRDDPRQLFGAVRNYLRLEEGAPSPGRQFADGVADADAMVNRLVARVRRRGRLRAAGVSVALRRARALAGLREMPKYLLVLTLAALREHLLLVADDLVRRGLLDQRDDVAFCSLYDLKRGLAGAQLQEAVSARRSEYDQELRRRRIPRLLLSDGTEPETLAVPHAEDGALTGTPASAGTVTAAVRVVLDPVGAHLEPGEILVAPSTDPGWTPLFLTAAGLVMEMGGANSHGAVVAREYGIPAVVGVAEATVALHTGEHVTVDGAAGTVRVVDGPADTVPDAGGHPEAG